MESPSEAQSIRSFFKDKSVFVTGATGFVGRFLIYKLLKTCEVKRVYILLRGKRGMTTKERARKFAGEELFKHLPDIRLTEKIVAMEGDVNKPGLGLSPEDIQTVIEEVNILYHSAATIRFNEPMKTATVLHVYGTNSVMKLSKKIKNLDVLVSVSSVACHTPADVLKEEVMPTLLEGKRIDPTAFTEMMDAMSPDEAKKVEPDYVGDWPKYLNTYSLTKTLAETVVYDQREGLRIAIVRPPFLFSAAKEPASGWFDTPQAGAGIAAVFSLGMVRVSSIRSEAQIECIPIDMCVNVLITAAWYMARVSDEQFKVFNMSISRDNYTTVKQVQKIGMENGFRAPSLKQIRPPHALCTDKMPSKSYVLMKSFVTHYVFAYFIDFLLIITGQKPLLVGLTKKIVGTFDETFNKMSEYKEKLNISLKNIDAMYESVAEEEKDIFYYDIKEIDWKKLLQDNHMHFRRTVLKEPDDTIPYARKRLRVVGIVYFIFKLSFWALSGAAFYGIFHLVSFSYVLTGAYFVLIFSLFAVFVLNAELNALFPIGSK